MAAQLLRISLCKSRRARAILALPVMVGLIVGKGIVEAIFTSAAIQFRLDLLSCCFSAVSWFLMV